MEVEQINYDQYAVVLYDSIGELDDYVAGIIKRQPELVKEYGGGREDLNYFMFYPSSINPICAGDLKRISEYCIKLNGTLKE